MDLKGLIWLGDSRKILRSFPKDVKLDLGQAIFELQQGIQPPDSRPMKAIGAGVYELKDQDDRAWYRVIYFMKIRDKIVILHSFEKKSRKTPKSDLDLAKRRLKGFLSEVKK